MTRLDKASERDISTVERAKIGIIGAGPAGMMAALQAAQFGGRVLLFDGNKTAGRKLMVTGNGRCNISNSRIDPRMYACADPAFMPRLLARFGHRDLVDFLAGIAVPVFAMPDGWCYPRSESAAAVVEAFAVALQVAGVELHFAEKVRDFNRGAGGWRIVTAEEYHVDRLIIAAGGEAQPNLGSRGELFPLLRSLGHRVLPSRPALAPITADMRRLHKLQGVRMDLGLELWQDDNRLGQSTGNAIFSQWGLNGPAAMDISHLVSGHPDEGLTLEINFIAGAEEAMAELLRRFSGTEWPVAVVLGGLLPPKVARFIVQSAALAAESALRSLGERDLTGIWQSMTGTRIRVEGTRGFEFAQVSAGGVPVNEVEPESMASRKAEALFLAGEVLDVVGPCGGYNLQFAFSTGALAGRAAAG
jgi:predicted Rossmann fold flavoprotein